MENEKTDKIYKILKFVIIILSVFTLIPNIIPLITVLPAIYSQEIDYMEDIYLTAYCIIGVLIPLGFIFKSGKIIESLAYRLTNKDDFTDVIKYVGLFILILSAVVILKVSYYSSYNYHLKFDKIFSAALGLLVYLKADKINLRLLTYFKTYKEKIDEFKDKQN